MEMIEITETLEEKQKQQQQLYQQDQQPYQSQQQPYQLQIQQQNQQQFQGVQMNARNEIVFGNEPILLKTLRQRFDFLSEAETTNFINSHPWLLEEKDESIMIDFLKNYHI